MYAQFISLYPQLLTKVVMDEGRDSQVAALLGREEQTRAKAISTKGRSAHAEILQAGLHGQCFPNIKFR